MTAVTACRMCGTEPLENARFCHGCGSPVVGVDTHAEYKQVTVLFADVVHSMDIAAAVGAERLPEIMTDLIDRASAVVQRYGGTVDKFTGDGIMAVFGAPVALEDHAIRACLAALGVQEETKRLAVNVGERDDVDLQLRVGLNSGQVIAGEIGSGALGYTALGEQVGMAQRMESVAPPGGVMLSESTARLVEGAVTLDARSSRGSIPDVWRAAVANHDLLSVARISAQGTSDVVNQTSIWLQEIQAISAVATTVGVLLALHVAAIREPRKAAAESRRHKAQMDALRRAHRKRVTAQARKVIGTGGAGSGQSS
jgi:class 3 adenylate cyclase